MYSELLEVSTFQRKKVSSLLPHLSPLPLPLEPQPVLLEPLRPLPTRPRKTESELLPLLPLPQPLSRTVWISDVVLDVAGICFVGNASIYMDVCGVVFDVTCNVVTMQFVSPLTPFVSNRLLQSLFFRCISYNCAFVHSSLVHDVRICSNKVVLLWTSKNITSSFKFCNEIAPHEFHETNTRFCCAGNYATSSFHISEQLFSDFLNNGLNFQIFLLICLHDLTEQITFILFTGPNIPRFPGKEICACIFCACSILPVLYQI